MCQRHTNGIHAPVESLCSISSPYPFSQWGFDLIGKIHPSSSLQHKFILITTEYFTKWDEAIPIRKADGNVVALFVFDQIICHFGIPNVIVIDNGKSFCNKAMEELCHKYKITHRVSSPYYPQENGLVESFKKMLVKILKKIVNDSQWD